ncbi:MAG TPA: 5-carboxymethyl-2-hydroxymuconate Delta-isomerase, partial [Bacillales bacterium]|nr:5-carboxymethyl-2-hydroxymuconate Delta-isomerase [Bacillales bacterium]
YTDNLNPEADIPGLLKKFHEVLLARSDHFPTGGLRSRAIELHDYRVADGAEDDAFVHVTLKIGGGRSAEVKKEACEALFEVMKRHFEKAFADRFLALSLELFEFQHPTYKQNNIHQRFN